MIAPYHPSVTVPEFIKKKPSHQPDLLTTMRDNDSDKTLTQFRYLSIKLTSLLEDDEMDSNLIWCIKENVLNDIIEDTGEWPDLHFKVGGRYTELYKCYHSRSPLPLVYPCSDWRFAYFSSLTEYSGDS